MNGHNVADRLRDLVRPSEWSGELHVAVSVVRNVALLARAIQERNGRETRLKPDRSPVTAADFAVQAVVADRLARTFPTDTLVAEEGSALLRTQDADLASVLAFVRRLLPEATAASVLAAIDRGTGSPADRFWTLDPVDGTEGFINAGQQYVVALALVVGGRVEIGVLGCPRLSLTPSRSRKSEEGDNRGSIVFAVRGHGAVAGSLATGAEVLPLNVSDVREPRDARLLRSRAGHHIDLHAFDEVVRALGIRSEPILMDSQAKHALLAAGLAELLIRIPARPDYVEKIWDHAAGALILEEAGGRVTDLFGKPLDFGCGRLLALNRGVIASNGLVHDAVVDAVRRTGISET